MTRGWLLAAWSAVAATVAISAGLIRLGHTLWNWGNP